MKYKVFNIPVFDTSASEEQLNCFLQDNIVHNIKSFFCSSTEGAYWTFCVEYSDKSTESSLCVDATKKDKVDYREILDEATYIKFTRLREIRKQISTREAIPAYAVFTNDELVAMAKLDKFDKESLMSIPGVGERKIEKYANVFYGELKKSGII